MSAIVLYSYTSATQSILKHENIQFNASSEEEDNNLMRAKENANCCIVEPNEVNIVYNGNSSHTHILTNVSFVSEYSTNSASALQSVCHHHRSFDSFYFFFFIVFVRSLLRLCEIAKARAIPKRTEREITEIKEHNGLNDY